MFKHWMLLDFLFPSISNEKHEGHILELASKSYSTDQVNLFKTLNTAFYKSNSICNSRLSTLLSTNQAQSAIYDFCLLEIR